ncbi:MAG: putative cytokinetic ring protein SteA [Acidimicrobiales bacterium]
MSPRRKLDPGNETVVGVARVDRRTKNLVRRLAAGEVAVIDHEDLDRVAAETLIQAQAGAVVNAADSISGRYPNLGPLLLAAAGIPILDGAGEEVMTAIVEGQTVTVDGTHLLLDGHKVAEGTRQTIETLEHLVADARQRMGAELERFAENTLEYLRKEGRLLTHVPDVPEVGIDFKDRHVLIVVRGIDYRDDLRLLRQTGYLQEMRPLLVGVDGGADALIEAGCAPDVIIGDFDSVSERALRCGAKLVVHAYAGGQAPGAARLKRLGLDYSMFESPGTSEDIAMLLAYEHGAELIVAVGTHNSMVEFLDKGRAGMASTFLVRMKVGPILVDAKGVSRLYKNRIRKRDLALLVVSAVFTLAVVFAVTEPLRLLVRALWVRLT